MAQSSAGVTLTVVENLNVRKVVKAEATKLRALDVFNGTDKRIYLHLYDKVKTSEVNDAKTAPALPPIAIGPYESLHMNPDVVGRDFTNGIVAQALIKPRSTEHLNAADWGVDVSFWTRSN